MEYFAAIDIGSNAVRLLIKRQDKPTSTQLGKVALMRLPLRLGQEVFTTGSISKKKADDLCTLIKSFSLVMSLYDIKPEHFRGCATAAMREATNGQSVLNDIYARTGVRIELISGKEEAAIVRNVNWRRVNKSNLLFVDVGGGSTEISLICDGNTLFTQSYGIGTVRMINGIFDETVVSQLRLDLQATCCLYGGVSIVGAGGNINKLFSLTNHNDEEVIERRMDVSALRNIYNRLNKLTIAQRAEAFDLKPDRADVIVPAAQIFLIIADAIGADTIEVPALGLSDGIIEELVNKRQDSITQW